MKKKEVYLAYSKDNELLYIGQGNIGRHKHCASGCSHNKSLNRYYFLNGEDSSIKTIVHSFHACEKEAVKKEIELIKKLKPLYNTNHAEVLSFKDRQKTGRKQSFKELAEEYYNLDSQKESLTNKVEIKSIDSKLYVLKSLDREFSEIVSTIGIDEIKSTGFHKTKSKAKYKKFVGINSISRNKTTAFANLKIREGDFLPYSDIKSKIQKAFDKMGIDAVARATDIKEVYNVKRTARQGVEGFLIGEKI